MIDPTRQCLRNNNAAFTAQRIICIKKTSFSNYHGSEHKSAWCGQYSFSLPMGISESENGEQQKHITSSHIMYSCLYKLILTCLNASLATKIGVNWISVFANNRVWTSAITICLIGAMPLQLFLYLRYGHFVCLWRFWSHMKAPIFLYRLKCPCYLQCMPLYPHRLQSLWLDQTVRPVKQRTRASAGTVRVKDRYAIELPLNHWNNQPVLQKNCSGKTGYKPAHIMREGHWWTCSLQSALTGKKHLEKGRGGIELADLR
jgi:hypothetical protein